MTKCSECFHAWSYTKQGVNCMQHQVLNEDESYSPRLRRYRNKCRDFMVVESVKENQIHKFNETMQSIYGDKYKVFNTKNVQNANI